MILLRVIPEGQWRHIIFTALFYENIHGRYCACIQKRNNEHSHSFLIIVFKMKISSFSSVYNKLGLNSLLFFCHAASEQDERDHRPTSNEFFQASSVSSCVILLRVIPEGQWRHTLFTALSYSMKTFTVAAAHASKRVTMITAIITHYRLQGEKFVIFCCLE